jgi:hypothetical protein
MANRDHDGIVLEDTQPAVDERLYVPHSTGWSAHIKHSGGTERCFAQHPGQDFFHLLITGEIYLENGGERFCLTCAMRRGIINRDRKFLKNDSPMPTIQPLDDMSDVPLQGGSDES